MNRGNLITNINKLMSGYISEMDKESFDVTIVIEKEKLHEALKKLKEDKNLKLDYLMCLTGVDYPPDKLELVYHLYSMEKKHRVCVKSCLDRKNPVAPSVTDLWKAAEWHERETYDLIGIKFEGNPDLRRILLPEDFVGHPLQKDFTSPEVVKSPTPKEMMQPKP